MTTPRKRVPVQVDRDNDVKTFEYEGQTFTLRNKFKIGKFFRALETNPMEAIALIMDEDSLERFEDLEMDMDGFKEFMTLMSEALSGTDSKN